MKILLKNELDKGSLGLSTGLEYEGAFYSSKEEVLELAKLTSKQHGRYISHIRSEDITLEDAVDEIIEIGRTTQMPVQISHIKIGMKDKWNRSNEILKKLDEARKEGIDITADIYPYAHWNSTLKVLFPKRDYSNLTSARFAVDQLFDASESVLVNYAPIPSYKGKTISVIAQERNEEAAITLIKLIAMAAEF
jgi:N-acyl-D-aspartate/D-glutamate deacylase